MSENFVEYVLRRIVEDEGVSIVPGVERVPDPIRILYYKDLAQIALDTLTRS